MTKIHRGIIVKPITNCELFIADKISGYLKRVLENDIGYPSSPVVNVALWIRRWRETVNV